MRKAIFLTALFAAALAYSAQGTLYPVLAIPDGETRLMDIRYEDPKYNDAYFADKPINQKLLHLEAASSIETVAKYKGEGAARQLTYQRNEILHNKTKSTWLFTFEPGDKLILKTIDHNVVNPAGKNVRHEYFDLRDPIFDYPPDTYHAYVLEIFFRTLPLKPGYKGQFYFWLAPKSVMRMMINVEKVETIKVPMGEVECYCLQMSPNLEDFLGKAGRVVQPLVPKFTFWLAVKGTHPVVKYSGPLGEVNLGGAPVEVHELRKITPPL